MSSHDALSIYLRRAAGEPFELSVTDCGMFVGDWVLECSGIDPCSKLRGTYPTADKKQKMLDRTHLIHIMRNCAEACGFSETKFPERGNVGAFVVGRNMAIGIYTGTSWAGKNERGVFVSRNAHLLQAYKVTHV